MNDNAQLYLVDVFTQDSFRGNPVAIIIPSAEPSPKRMLQIAQWLGLPETVFVLPHGVEAKAEAEADYAVRIWSTIRELPFAGHPSIGVAHVLLSKGIISARNGKFIQRSPAGLVQMRVEVVEDQHRIFFQTPIPDVRSVNRVEGAAVITALRHPSGTDQIFVVDAGARWLVVELPAASDVDRLRPDFDAINSLSDVHRVSGITVLGTTGLRDVHYEVRSFAPAIGVPEDAVCGGGNACAAALVAYRNDWRVGSATHVAGQGKQVHRSGRVFWEGPDADKRIEIGGFAVIVSEGYCLCC